MFITITGTQGSGKSTICNILKQKYGFEVVKVGDIVREYARDHKLSVLDVNFENENTFMLDYIMDNRIIELANELDGKNVVFDSRMAWHFVPESLKVFVKTDDETAAKRIMGDKRANEEYSSLKDAMAKIKARRESESKRYKELYAVDNLDLDNYDLILDSTNTPAEKLAEKIMDEVRKKFWFV